jgi:hypothetical protein
MAAQTLEICDPNGQVRLGAVIPTFALMLYPDDPSGRAGFEARLLADVAAGWPGAILINHDTLKRALDSAPHPLAPGGRLRRWTDGTMAGNQLIAVMSIAHNLPCHASRAKALYLIEWERYQSGRPGTKSDLKSIWARYRKVAHFWAAFNLRHQMFQRLEWCAYTEHHDFWRFLGEAEIIRRWAANFRTSSIAAPLLDESAWSLPRQFTPLPDHPEWLPTGRICLPGIKPWAIEQLNRYPDPPPARRAGRRRGSNSQSDS